MPKGPKDLNQTAFDIVARSTGQPTSEQVSKAKKGGAARSEKLTPERRSEITRAAAAKRWKPAQLNGFQILRRALICVFVLGTAVTVSNLFVGRGLETGVSMNVLVGCVAGATAYGFVLAIESLARMAQS